jgi:hypothetical protein
MTTEQIKTWNCLTLAEALEQITGQRIIDVSWCDEKGNPKSRKEKPEPRHLVAMLVREAYVEYKLTKMPGFVRSVILGEVGSEGPSAFVIIDKDEPVFVRAIFRSGRETRG